MFLFSISDSRLSIAAKLSTPARVDASSNLGSTNLVIRSTKVPPEVAGALDQVPTLVAGNRVILDL